MEKIPSLQNKEKFIYATEILDKGVLNEEEKKFLVDKLKFNKPYDFVSKLRHGFMEEEKREGLGFYLKLDGQGKLKFIKGATSINFGLTRDDCSILFSVSDKIIEELLSSPTFETEEVPSTVVTDNIRAGAEENQREIEEMEEKGIPIN